MVFLSAFDSPCSCLFLLLATIVVGACLPVLGAEATPPRVQVLDQQSETFGHVIAYVGPHAIKVLLDNNNYFLCAEPDFRVLLYNTVAKTGFEQSYRHWQTSAHGVSAFGALIHPVTFPVMKLRSSKAFGLECTRYSLPIRSASGAWEPSSALGEFLVWDAPSLDSHLGKAEETLLNCPVKQGIPISFELLPEPKHESNVSLLLSLSHTGKRLQTKSVKEIPYDPKFFAYPTGYKQARQEIEVLISPQKTKELEENFKEMGLGN